MRTVARFCGSGTLRAPLLAALAIPALLAITLSATPAHGTIFIDALGFEDDVDFIISCAHTFIVIPEEAEDGSDARLRIIGINFFGVPVAEMYIEDGLVGYENGVDPFIIGEGVGLDSIILVPMESEDGSEAHLYMLSTMADGAVIDIKDIALGNLGFREDVDGIWDGYNGSMAFFLLETEDRTVRGILAIDVSNVDGDWGSSLLLSTDGRIAGDANLLIDWLPELAEGVDPEAFQMDDRMRLLVPVSDAAGSDLLFVDFESDEVAGDLPPSFMEYSSVKAINAGGALPLSFPGYERDVDIMLLDPLLCEDDRSILIPVEGPAEADLYKIDENGDALWVYSVENPAGPSILGYEAGVDLVTMCGLAIAPEDRVIVPIENAAGTDADLFIVDIATGLLFRNLENPTVNPGLKIPGYEIGVDVVRWLPGAHVAAVEGSGGVPGLIVFGPNGVVLSSLFDAGLLGFRRSVGLIVSPFAPTALIVPIGTDDGSDGDVRVFVAPGLGGGYSLETAVPGLELNPFQWDVDLGVVDKTQPGELTVCLAEESPSGDAARIRFETTPGLPGDRVLVMATDTFGGVDGSLYFVDIPTATVLLEKDDVLGLETGLDMITGAGPVKPGAFPFFPRPTSVDHDGDPTLTWDVASGIADLPGRVPGYTIPLRHTNPFVAPGRIDYELPEKSRVSVDVFDVAGRLIARVFQGEQEAGEHGLIWDAREEGGRALASGVYFVRVRTENGEGVSKLVLVR